MRTTFYVIQVLEIEAESATDAAWLAASDASWACPYHVHVRNAVTEAQVECALVGAVEVCA